MAGLLYHSHSRAFTRFVFVALCITTFYFHTWIHLRDPLAIQSKSDSIPHQKRVLMLCHSIPTPLKGGDVRATQAVEYLVDSGHLVDFVFWRSYEKEWRSADGYDDSLDRERLWNSGVNKILGPYERLPFNDGVGYDIVLFWAWPHIEFLDMLVDSVAQIKVVNARVVVMVAIDDVGLAARMLKGALKSKEVDFHPEVENISIYMMANNGDLPQSTVLSKDDFDRSEFEYASAVSAREGLIYAWADVLIGINADTVSYFQKAFPLKVSRQLRYMSPLVSVPINFHHFHQRKDFVFFGYHNSANREGIAWFMENVLPLISHNFKLHVAGSVDMSSVCTCSGPSACISKHENIVCHGILSDSKLDSLISSSRVGINPVLEPSGVATKTCRTMALGTPVVVSLGDGTLTPHRRSDGAKQCAIKDALCFAAELKKLLTDEREWQRASKAAPKFIAEEFGAAAYRRDWSRILNLPPALVNVAIQGKSFSKGGDSSGRQNWHIANTLTKAESIRLAVVTSQLSPPIPGVQHMRSLDASSFQADVVILQDLPHNSSFLPEQFCGPGCRIIRILPQNLDSIPKEWNQVIEETTDYVWGLSEYNPSVSKRSGNRPSRPGDKVCHNVISVPTWVEVDLIGAMRHENAEKTTSNFTPQLCSSDLEKEYVRNMMRCLEIPVTRTCFYSRWGAFGEHRRLALKNIL